MQDEDVILLNIFCYTSFKTALKRLRASNDIEDDVEEMKAEQRAHGQEATISMLQLLRSSSLRMPLVIAVTMQLSQQFSGINAVSTFSFFLFVLSF